MLEIENRTPYAAQLVPTWDANGLEVAVLIIKATFEFDARGNIEPAAEQVPVELADRYRGEPGASSVVYESDLALRKPAADIAVNATAYAPGGRPVRSLHVVVRVGSVSRRLRVLGDRKWTRRFGILTPTFRKRFTEMPIVYERAFGGSFTGLIRRKHVKPYLRNPVGCGFRRRFFAPGGEPLPNIEWSGRSRWPWGRRRRPAGLGFVAKNWSPRYKLAGTYDDAWAAHRMPFLPADFDHRFFQAASDGMTCPYPKGGETVTLENLTPGGHVQFRLPEVVVPALYDHVLERGEVKPRVDTVLIEPDLSRVILTLRAIVPCHGNALKLRRVLLAEVSAGERRAFLAGKRYRGAAA